MRRAVAFSPQPFPRSAQPGAGPLPPISRARVSSSRSAPSPRSVLDRGLWSSAPELPSPDQPLGSGVGGREMRRPGGPGRVQIVRREGTTRLARVTPKGSLTDLRPLTQLPACPVRDHHGNEHRAGPAESACFRRIPALGAGLTAERVPPAPRAAVTIATKASRELRDADPERRASWQRGRRPAGGRWWAGSGRPGWAWAGLTVERLALLTSRRHRGREEMKCFFS